jgi:hypothetical protein
MKSTLNAPWRWRSLSTLLPCLASAALFVHCGGDNSTPVSPPTPVPTANPGPSPAPAALACNPTPPPIYGMRMSIRDASGYRKVLAAVPLVINSDEYCGRVGFYRNQWYCETRQADDPLRAACDAAAVGRAGDTGRWGPTWFFEGGPCTSTGNEPGCENHETDQFLVYAKGHGEFEACAALSIPFEPEGSRCGQVVVP